MAGALDSAGYRSASSYLSELGLRHIELDFAISPAPERTFKKVSDAYQVLSDPQKRALYDKYGEQALSGEGGVAEESEEGGAAGFSGFRSADDLFQTFFGARGASVFGSGASVFEVDTEGSGGGAGNVFSFVVGDEDEEGRLRSAGCIQGTMMWEGT